MIQNQSGKFIKKYNILELVAGVMIETGWFTAGRNKSSGG
jgi:hypothetical protein